MGLELVIAIIGVMTLFLTWGILRKMNLFDVVFSQIKTVIESNTDAIKSTKDVNKEIVSNLRTLENRIIEDNTTIKNALGKK